MDKGENKIDKNIYNQNNFNYINSIIINYVELNTNNNRCLKENEIYDSVLKNLKFNNIKTLEEYFNENEKNESNNYKYKTHKINLGKENEKIKTGENIDFDFNKNINNKKNKFLTSKKKHSDSIKELLFKTYKENQESQD